MEVLRTVAALLSGVSIISAATIAPFAAAPTPTLYDVIQLTVGYVAEVPTGFSANGSTTLVTARDSSMVVLVDTGGPWRQDTLIQGLADNYLTPSDVTHVVGTHGHSDHIGNLNLFPNAFFVVMFDVNQQDVYFDSNLVGGDPYVLGAGLSVIPTPGHTCSDVSLVVENSQLGTVVVAGDLFESEADLDDPTLWMEVSLNPEVQQVSRDCVLCFADYIVPGHGAMFKVKNKYIPVSC